MTPEKKKIRKIAHTIAAKDWQLPIENAAISFKEGFCQGAVSQAAKEYWQKGMYTKKEVKELCKSAFITGSRIDDISFNEWIEKNL